jgi:sarcosine oxidase, subunit gamma
MADARPNAIPEPRTSIAGRLDDLALVRERTRGEVALEHVPFLAQVDLRLHPSLVDRAPYPLSTEPNTAWEDGPRAALWLGPDEWLVLGPPASGPEIVAELEDSLAGLHRSVVDVGANRVALELGGDRRFDLLSHVCSLDLDPRSWRAGLCAQTLLGKTQAILHERTETTGMLVRTSFADYLIERLLAAASTWSSGERV